jgi:hypothetical protein
MNQAGNNLDAAAKYLLKGCNGSQDPSARVGSIWKINYSLQSFQHPVQGVPRAGQHDDEKKRSRR